MLGQVEMLNVEGPEKVNQGYRNIGSLIWHDEYLSATRPMHAILADITHMEKSNSGIAKVHLTATDAAYIL